MEIRQLYCLIELSWISAERFRPGMAVCCQLQFIKLYLLLREWNSTPIAYCALQVLHADSCKARIFLCFHYTANLVTAASTTEFACTNWYLSQQSLANSKCVFIWICESMLHLKAHHFMKFLFFFFISSHFWTLKDMTNFWLSNSFLIFASIALFCE